jgi:hypothetical protein
MSTLCKKSFCWFSFLEKENSCSLCFKIWNVTKGGDDFPLGVAEHPDVGAVAPKL